MMGFKPPFEHPIRVRILADCDAAADRDERVRLTAGTELLWTMDAYDGRCIVRDPRDRADEPSLSRCIAIDRESFALFERLARPERYHLRREVNAPLDRELGRSVLLQIYEEVALVAILSETIGIVESHGRIARVNLIDLEVCQERPLVAV